MRDNQQLYISVIGAGEADLKLAALAEEIGLEIAKRGHVLVCGGMGGVMDAAAKGASRSDGISIGILPGDSRRAASPHLTLSIPTDMSYGRNFLVVLSGDAVIAVGGEYGTLSEIAFAVKLKKPLVIMEGSEQADLVHANGLAASAKDAKQAVDLVEQLSVKNES